MQKVLSLNDLAELTTLSKTEIYRLIKAGEFPVGFYITPKRRVWSQEEYSEWLESRKQNAANA